MAASVKRRRGSTQEHATKKANTCQQSVKVE